MAYDIVYINQCCVGISKEFIFWICWVGRSINAKLLLRIDVVFFYIFADFLYNCCSVVERCWYNIYLFWYKCNITYICVWWWAFLFFLLILSVLVLHILQICCLVCTHSELLYILCGVYAIPFQLFLRVNFLRTYVLLAYWPKPLGL